MIVTDQSKLRVMCCSTTIKQCAEIGIFEMMENELKKHKGVSGIGLAAPQIGYYLRCCVMRIPAHKDRAGVEHAEVKLNMIDPIIEKAGNPGRVQGERCLSLPGITTDTLRFGECTVSWLDYDAKEFRRASFYGLEAFCVQHEIDHLNGILMLDRAPAKAVKTGRNEPCPLCAAKGIHIKYKKCEAHYQA